MMLIPVDKIIPNPEQPRVAFDPAEIGELAASIRMHGLINPIAVEELEGGMYQLIDGERRWRAHQAAGIEQIEASVRPMNGTDPKKRLLLALVANLQREDLNPIEEGQAYKALIDGGQTLVRVAALVGKSEGQIKQRIELLQFDPEIQRLYAQRKLPLGEEVVYLLRDIPLEDQVELAKFFAIRKMTIANIKRFITMFKRGNPERKAGKMEPENQRLKRSDVPVLVISGWDATRPAANMLNFQDFETALETTCKDCDMFEMASKGICGACPLVELARKIGNG